MEEIVLRIGKDGKINLNVNGVKGTSCKDLTKSLERALGQIEETKNTGEFYEQKNTIEGQQSVGGEY